MQYSFFDAVNYDRLYSSADWSRYFMQFIGNGVYASSAVGMQVYSKGEMTLGVLPGSCFINGRCGYADGSDAVTLEYGGNGAYRYDAVCARLDLDARDIHIEVVRGDDADSFSEAVKPLPVREGLIYDLILAYVKVGEGVTSVDDTMVQDMRPDSSVCGFVTGLIRQFNSTEFFRQYSAMLDDLLSRLGTDNHIDIDWIDHTARAEAVSLKAQTPYSISGLLQI